MALVLFLRGVNVGGHKTFKPSELAKKLAHLECVSIGAAGTFVIHKSIAQTALRTEVIRFLKFEPEMMICRAKNVLDLAEADPFSKNKAEKDVTRYVSVMAKPLKAKPRLPISQPESELWQVRIIAIAGSFVLSLHRRMGKRLIYPNEVVEKLFDVPATTRNWNTIVTVCETLRAR